MNFPIVILKAGEAPIYHFTEAKFGLISRGGEAFYRQGTIYDSDCNVFSLKGNTSYRKANPIKSLMYFQQMYVVSPTYTHIQKIALAEFKKIIIDHISFHKRYWVKKD